MTEARRKAVLVSIQLPEVTDEDLHSSLAELTRLVETLGFEVVGTLTQRRASPSPATAIGAGKLKELARWTGGSGVVPSVSKAKSKAAERFEDAEPDEDDE